MALKGPIPKRSGQRHGHRAKSVVVDITHGPAGAAVPIPVPDPGWHPLARDWFVSLGESGQHRWYEPSDWTTARVWAEVLSRQLESERISSVMIQAWASSAGELLTTEGSRRRARLELERAGQDDADEAAAVTAMDAYRAALGMPNVCDPGRKAVDDLSQA